MKINELLSIIEVEKLIVIDNNYSESFKWNNWDSYRNDNDVKLEDKYGECEIIYISVSKYNELEIAIK